MLKVMFNLEVITITDTLDEAIQFINDRIKMIGYPINGRYHIEWN